MSSFIFHYLVSWSLTIFMSAFIMKEIVIFFYLLLLPLAIDTKQRNIFRNTAKLRTQRPQTVDLLKNSMLCTILSHTSGHRLPEKRLQDSLSKCLLSFLFSQSEKLFYITLAPGPRSICDLYSMAAASTPRKLPVWDRRTARSEAVHPLVRRKRQATQTLCLQVGMPDMAARELWHET